MGPPHGRTTRAGIEPPRTAPAKKGCRESRNPKERVADWLASYQSDLTWAVKNFAARSASELELLATIVYVDRELADRPTSRPLRYLAQRVRVVKPRFLETYVLEKCQEAQQMGLLSSVP